VKEMLTVEQAKCSGKCGKEVERGNMEVLKTYNIIKRRRDFPECPFR
jgi:hypothetical protein